MIDKHEMRWWALSKIGRDLMMIRPETIIALLDEFEQLHAQIEAMRKQEPVAWFEKSSDLDAWFLAYSQNPNAETKSLYLAPGAQPAPSVPDDNDTHDPSTAAIEYALKAEEGLDFLYYWFHGDFDVIRREWSDAPEEVFIGADPLYRAPGAQESNDV